MKKNITILIGVAIVTIVATITLGGKGKQAYTKEFTYLPQQKGMTLEKIEKPVEDKMGVGKYIVKNKKSKDVLEEYEKQLKNDGWKIVEDKKPILIKAEKDEHKTVVVPNQDKEDVKLTIVSK